MTHLYNDYCTDCGDVKINLALNDSNGSFKELLKIAENTYKELHQKGSYQPDDITQYNPLIDATHDILKEAFKKGIADNVIPEAMRKGLENDIYIFSGLKTHAQLLEASRLLLTDDGKIKPFYQFSRDVAKISSNYNQLYLEAEYQYAVSSSQQAANWAKIEEGGAKYNIQYRTAGDEKVRDHHAVLNGITLAFDDEFWNEYYPPNGWRCRCRALQVLKSKYPVSDSIDAINKGQQATSLIGKDGKNRLEIFRFNPGKKKVVFPPEHPYQKVQDAGIVKTLLMQKAEINLSELIKGDIPTNKEIKDIIAKHAELYPEDFRNGLKEIKVFKSKNYMMQHSMSYSPSKGEWIGGSTITLSSHTFGSFNPLEELRNAFGSIKKGETLTFNQEYAIESLWHEILHAKTLTFPSKLSALQTQKMETVNQFVARHTYPSFIERMGSKASNQKEILDNGYGYKTWVKNFRNELDNRNIEEQKAVEYLTPHLMKDYRTIGSKINDLFNDYPLKP